MIEREGQLLHVGRIGVVVSRYNELITRRLLDGAREACREAGTPEAELEINWVDGAFDLPAVASAMAQSGRYAALIALGAVIRGDTYHFEVVSNESARGISEVQVETGVPVANAILTTDNDDQALARMSVKGAEAAAVAIEMVNLLKSL